MTVEQHGPLPLANFMPGRNDPVDGAPNAIDSIVLHTTVGWIGSADARFHNATAQVSAHFGVRVDGSLWQWVQTWDTAYHAGLFYENLRSIGIEHEDEGLYNAARPDALYARSAALVAQLCQEHHIPCVRGTGGPGIYDHRDVIKTFGSGTATACPDALDTDRIIRQAADILAAPMSVSGPAVTIDATVQRAPVQPPMTVVQQWAAIYKAEAPKAGIRPELAFAQALHETGHFTFTGIAQSSWNNPAGLGVTGTAGVGNRFLSKYDGVIAHLQHLLMYFAADHTAYCQPPTIDQRHFAHRGLADDIRKLDGQWAVPGVGYGDSILALVPDATALLA